MAGYIFAVAQDRRENFISHNLGKGFFTPFAIELTEDMTSRQKKGKAKILAATYGDLITMEPGDNIYFLTKRKIYGIGSAVQIGNDCKYDNYLNSSALLPDDITEPTGYLTTQNPRARWVVFFEPSPHFFKKGVDMDDALRFRPQAFRTLRAFENLTFIKLDDEENRALKEFISLSNESAYDDIEENVFPFDMVEHQRMKKRDLSEHAMDISKCLKNPISRDYSFSEMLIESCFMQQLHEGMSPFGQWDYLTHQLIASPFKPLKYIDKIDVFGYRFSSNYEDSPKLITKYVLVELKKGKIDEAALNQTMQYVDWICTEYASGDYSLVEAYVIGNKTTRNIDEKVNEICSRSFIRGTYPAVSEKWNDLKLVHYELNDSISFQIIEI